MAATKLNPQREGSIQYWLSELKKPIEADVGLTDRERQGIYNLARQQKSGAYNAAADEMTGALAGQQGFRVGESGIADTALGQLRSKQAQEMGTFGQEIATEEAKNRFAQEAKLAELQQARLGQGGSLAAQLGQIRSQNRATSLSQSKFEQELEWAKEQDAKNREQWGTEFEENTRRYDTDLAFSKEKEKADLAHQATTDLMTYMGLMQNSQSGAYAQYWQSLMASINS